MTTTTWGRGMADHQPPPQWITWLAALAGAFATGLAAMKAAAGFGAWMDARRATVAVAKLDAEQSFRADLMAREQQANARLDAQSRELNARLDQQQTRFDARIEALETKIARLQEDLENEREEKAGIEGTLRVTQIDLVTATQQRDRFEQQLAEEKARALHLKGELERRDGEVNDFKRRIDTLEREMEELLHARRERAN